jgi:RHS repeat-associated protein
LQILEENRMRSTALGCLAVLAVSAVLAPAVQAQTCAQCSTVNVPAWLCAETGSQIDSTAGCTSNACHPPKLSTPTFEAFPEPGGKFTVRQTLAIEAPRNHLLTESTFWPWVQWYVGSTVPNQSSTDVCFMGNYDRASTFVQRTGVTCQGGDFGTYSVRVTVCGNAYGCAPPAVQENIELKVLPGSLPGCTPPPSHCPEDQQSCALCTGPLGAASPAGGGPGFSPKGGGPGARLQYAAGGPGFAGRPGAAAWAATLGRGWSHEHAERVVPDPDDSHVWLITRHGTFREFRGLSGGVYTDVQPSDEHRKLHRTAAGWELRELDGTVHAFDAAGLWTSTTDRNGNAIAGTYSAGRLASVTFPDGRSETYGHHPSGKLASIAEVGVDGTTTRTWLYTWSGDDLVRIDRPDGTAWEVWYGDARYPGFATRLDLVGTHLARRIEGAWQLDGAGNVVKTWRGDPSADGPNAVDVYTFSYDNALTPAVTQVTDPLGNVTTYGIGRDPKGRKPRLDRIDGDCPSCATGPNEVREHADPANPLRPTRIVDGRLFETHLAYDANGQVASRTEAAGTPLARTTLWEYASPAFPAFPTQIESPSTSGGTRSTTFSYSVSGDLETRTEQGAESGGSFTLATATAYNPAGRPLTVDPPGHGTADATSFTYDPARGSLLPATRTDPLVGSSTFGYDPFNRRTSEIDPNGVQTVTTYDALNRVTSVTRKGATPAEDLVTTHEYDPFGDLFRTTLPRGNVLEYGYDAAGRLVSIERKPDAATSGERTLYTLDAYGHRTEEKLQRWDGAAWVTASSTGFEYSSRCHLDKVLHPDGTATEYAYDCNGNLQSVWDANHPRASNPMATQSYAYDALNRLASVTQPWAGGGTAVTTYGYDVQDHLASVTDAEGNVTTYVYGDRDLMTSQASPVSGVTTYTYGDDGELTSEIDARGIVMNRTVDAVGRVTAVTWPADPSLDIAYTYEDAGVPFSKGRLTRIARNETAIDYRYDRFGRTLQDGELAYGYDKNGNPTSLVYPGGVEAVTAYDFADRPASLLARRPGLPDQPLVTAAGYLPSGPLKGLTLGNGLTEARAFTSRYFPSEVALFGAADLLRWTYSTDSVGNILSIADALTPAAGRTYAYQDFHYFLTQGDGPWGTRSWSYDRIGNRLAETRGAVTDTYSYLPNPGGGRTPTLSQVVLGAGGTRTYAFGPAGHLEQTANGGQSTLFNNDPAGRLAGLESSASKVGFRYDGRGFLALADPDVLPFSESFESGTVCAWSAAVGLETVPVCETRPAVRPTYGSEGLLYALARNTAPERSLVFHFAGRPVAQLDLAGTTETWSFLTTDHLGTPIAATALDGTLLWEGGFEPFGADWSGASAAGVFLRFPGQWEEGAWSGVGVGVVYNVHRWYEVGTGRYVRPDPIGLLGGVNEYIYALGRPIFYGDFLGLYCTTDFVAHYFRGEGAPVDLGKVGLLSQFQGATSVRRATRDFRRQTFKSVVDEARRMCRGCIGKKRGTVYDTDRRSIDVTREDCLFSIGNSHLNRRAACGFTADCSARTFTFACSFSFGTNDPFQDPLDLFDWFPGDIELPGAKPYNIRANWIETNSGSGNF